MADVAIIDLLSRVRIEAPGCPEDVMELYMLDVIRDFCQQTRAWIHCVTMETVLKGVSQYDIEVPSPQAYPIAVEYLEVEEAPSDFKTTQWLDDHIPNWRTRKSDDLSFFTCINPRQITFAAVPISMGKSGGMNYRVSLKPMQNATAVPQTLADEWIEVWSDGTKAKLRAMPEKRWTDSKRAAELERMYRIGRGDARIRAGRNYGNPNETAHGPFFA